MFSRAILQSAIQLKDKSNDILELLEWTTNPEILNRAVNIAEGKRKKSNSKYAITRIYPPNQRLPAF